MMLEACEKTVFLGSGIETTVFKEIPCQRHSYFGRHQRETSCYMLVPKKIFKAKRHIRNTFQCLLVFS